MFTITGEVIKGKGNGKKMGFPTVNLIYPDKSNIRDGVYAGYAYIYDKRYKAAFCVGKQPMNNVINFEAHLVDAELGDMYGKEMTFVATDFIREMKKYNSEQELIQAIEKDVQYVREHF